MSFSGKTFKNFALILITESIGLLSNFAIIYILSQLYSPSELPSYTFSFTFISFFAIFANFGLGATLIRYLSAQKDKQKGNIQKLITDGFKLIFIFSLITSFFLFILSIFINQIYNIPDLGIILSFASIYLFFSNFIQYFENTFLGVWLYKYYALSKIVFNSLKLLVVLLNFVLNLSISIIIAFYALISLIHFLLLLIIQIRLKFIKRIFSYDRKVIKKLLKFSVFIFLPEILLFIIINFNQFILAFFISLEEFGVYSITLFVIQILSVPIIIFSKLIFPYVSYYLPREKENGEKIQNIFNLTFYYGLLIMIPLTIFFFIFSDHIIINIFGLDYFNASIYLKIYIFYLNFKMIDLVGGHFLWAANKPKLVFKLYAITTFFTITLTIILIPFFSTYGAILAVIIPHIAYIIITLIIVKKMNKIQFNFSTSISIVKFLISSIVSGIIAQFLIIFLKMNYYSIINLIFLSVLYFGFTALFFFITKAIQFDQIKELVKIVRDSLKVSKKKI